MELNQLHYFVTVAKVGNITKAAEQLYITQPALSRVILRLEEELGTPLFDRKGGRITLNRYGRTLLRYVEPGLNTIHEGVHAVIDELGNKQILIHNYLTADLFKAIVEKCQVDFDTVDFILKNIGNDADDTTLENEKPSVVMLPTNDFQGFAFPKSFQERWYVIYSSKYRFQSEFDGKSMTLEQLSQEPLAFYGSHFDREFIEEIFSSAKLQPRIIACTDLGESGTMISRGRAVGLVPGINYRSLIKTVDSIPIAAAQISDHPCTRTVYLGRSPKFLANVDEYAIFDSLINHLTSEFAETEEFFASYFGE